MTCIVGLVDSGRVWLAGDSAGVDDHYNRTIVRAPKVFAPAAVAGCSIGHPYIVGYTSSFRFGQLLETVVWPAFDPPGADAYRHLISVVVPFLRRELGSGGWMNSKQGRDRGGTCLIGLAGRLFRLEDTFAVFESEHPYDAVGCGDNYALGAAMVLRQLRPLLPVRPFFGYCLGAAALHSAGVSPPFHVIATGDASPQRLFEEVLS